MTVEKQSFTQPAGGRIPQPTVLTNVIATLKGTSDPEGIYVVSGHYDSMCSDPRDGKCDAPGANDDASGTAAVIELARVMSKRKFDATIVFMTVPGEEQGPFQAGRFLAAFGNGEVEMVIDGETAEISASSSPVGYEIDSDGELSELVEGERPSCE